jgi:hypothetical protein
MTEYDVEVSDRLRRRFRKKAVKSYLQGLAELITNSDGSYGNMEEKGEKASGEIKIIVDRIKRSFKIIDNAEGISKKGMEEIFTKTGAKHKTHKKGSRSLFGKGLPDTLFSPIIEIGSGEVHSINEGNYSWTLFKKKDDKEKIEIKPDGLEKYNVDKRLRDELGIEKGNGTVVKFNLSQKETFPRDDTIIKELSNFYMLRFINTNPDRKIKLIFLKDGLLHYTATLKYREPSENEKVGEDLIAEFKFKEYPPIKIKGSLFKTNDKLKGYSPFGLDKRESGLLIFDEYKNVMDLQLFCFDEDPNARYYFGLLELEGAYEVIRDYMDKEDEEILTDTRDGFDKRHIFYRDLRKIVDKWLKKIISQDQLEESKTTYLSKETLEKQKEAFQKLNEIYEQINTESEVLLGEDDGENKGLTAPLEFSLRTANLSLGKRYRVKLKADTKIIPLNSKIELSFDKSKVSINPKEVIIKKPKEGKIYEEYIEIIPLKLAKETEVFATFSEDIKSNLQLIINEEEYYQPKGVIEFYPRRFIAPPTKKKGIPLYIDLTKTEEEKVTIVSNSSAIHIEKSEYSLRRGVNVLKNIAKIMVFVKGVKDGDISEITAFCGKEKDSATIEVRNPKENKDSFEIFNNWIYKPSDTKFQIWPNIATKKMEINSNHPINRYVFGESKEDAELNVEAFPHCQLFLGELILNEFLKKAFHDARDSGAIRDPNIELDSYIREKKFEIGEDIIKLFVNDSRVKFFRSMTGIDGEFKLKSSDEEINFED